MNDNTLLHTDWETKCSNYGECAGSRVESNGITSKMGKWMRMKSKQNAWETMPGDCVYRPRSGFCYAIKSPKANITVYETVSCRNELRIMVSVHSTEETQFIIRELVPQKPSVTGIYLGLIHDFDQNSEYS
ncbi:unnamed protein product [Brugia pahangi]|uniref:Pept_C1 domain-containing protein n=1 Tax=Brugia pahangi TaxID=6280 RepID=A0A0N4T6K2_BRUPA|nr:unnamed protein product [Brugia pahangi]